MKRITLTQGKYAIVDAFMTAIINFVSKTFYNNWYRFFPPDQVKYWRHNDTARAKVVTQKDGSAGMVIEGEKEVMSSFPRGYLLTGPIATMKHYIKNAVFNSVFAEIEKMVAAGKYDLAPIEKMHPAIREIDATLGRLEEMEVVSDMKARIKLIRKVFRTILGEDDAYRLRAQAFLELIDQKKVRLSKADRYFARGKYWKVDQFRRLPGVGVVNAFDY